MKTSKLSHSSKAFQIVFNDEYLVVINKIAKILVQPIDKGRGGFKTRLYNTLTSLLAKALKQKVFPCHRLDRETTGLIIYAKSSSIQAEITEQFRKGQIKKKYLALVKGQLPRKRGLLEGYIIDRQARRFGEKPKKAKTKFRVLAQYQHCSKVELQPLTGRTNQLRIQLKDIGNPILGERKYAFGRDFPVNFKRLALHAYYLSFIHPVSRERVELKINLAEDMERFLQRWQ